MTQKNEAMRYKVADLLVEPARGRVIRGITTLSVPKLSFDLLLVLIKEAPNLVTIDALIDKVWRGLVVSPETVIQRIKLLRDALDDDPKNPRYVGSQRGWGYHLIAEVESLPTEPPPALPASLGAQLAPPADVKLIWRTQQLALSDGEHVLGRDDECTLVIDADTVSRRHAKLTIKQGQILIEDLKSKNGTHVDGIEIRGPTMLKNGSKITLGKEPLIVKVRNAATVTVAARPGGPRK